MRKLIAVDPDKCTGCEICELICSFTFFKEFNPKKARIRVLTWHREGVSVPIVCWQCEVPYCARACPTKALTKDEETGVINVDYEKCIGCKQCIYGCPFGNVYLVPGEVKPIKCETCSGDPPCVKLCPTGAITWIREDLAVSDKRLKTAKKIIPALLKRTGLEEE